MKKYVLLIILLMNTSHIFAVVWVSENPAVNFGNITYLSDMSGVQSVTVGADGSITGAESGHLVVPTDTSLTAFEVARTLDLHTDIRITTNNASSPATLRTTGCGTIEISDILTTAGTLMERSLSDPLSYAIGAKIRVVSFEASSACTITGTLSNHVKYSVKGGLFTPNRWSDPTAVPLTVSVTLVPLVVLEHDTNAVLNFGTFCSSADQPQSLTVTPSGTAGTSSTVCPVSSDISADRFTFFTSGTASAFDVSLPATATLHNAAGSTLTVNSFTSSCGTSGNSCTVTNGTSAFTVGGTITVPVRATPGDYEGTYQVSVTY